ncbi:unnamed protein product, partial [Adineta steineri]
MTHTSCNLIKTDSFIIFNHIIKPISITSDNIAYLIFTSGTTGIPKTVIISHSHLLLYLQSSVVVDAFRTTDRAIRLSSCTWDVYIHEIFGTLILLRSEQENREPISSRFIARILPMLPIGCQYINFSGATEGTVIQMFHVVTKDDGLSESGTVPSGQPMPYFRCHILDNGPIMNGYLNRPDLNSKALVQIPDESGKSYRTGDFARLIPSTVKVNGQRVEIEEIQAVIYQSNSSISNCAVVKVVERGRDHLIAYIQLNKTSKSVPFDEKLIRINCQDHLPQYMVPSLFILVDQLPFNSNGKLDKAALPKPNLSSLLLPINNDKISNDQDNEISMTNEQQLVHDLWCDILQLDVDSKIPINRSFFSLSGNSLAIMRLFAQYQIKFSLDTKSSSSFNIASLFRQPTIAEHTQILQQWLDHTSSQTHQPTQLWSTLNISQAEASYGQQRIFVDQTIRFSNETSVYNIPLVYRIISNSNSQQITTDRLRQAIDAIIAKHAILRTSLDWNIDTNVLVQYIQQLNYRNQYEFVISYVENDEEITKIINTEIASSKLFDINRGIVLRCHIIKYSSSRKDEEIYLEKNDIIIFNLHHIAFDGASRRIFFSDLKYNLEYDSTLINNENQFQYIDYSVYEKQMDIISSYYFWQSHLNGLNLERRIMLPFDRHRLLADQHSGFAHLIDIPFDNDLIHSFLDYASSQDITPFQLGLTIFYTFLYKLSQNQNDLCISCIHANRYRTELQNLIGMFVATLPHRIQIHPTYSFNHLIKQVQNEFYSILEHTHYPLQQILQDLDYKHSSAAFLNILFDFITYSSDTDLLSVNQTQFQPVPLKQMQNVVKFDMKLLFFHDPTVQNQTISCSLICSQDVFDSETVEELSKQFQHLLSQLFVKHPSSFDLVNQPISKLSFCLENVPKEIQQTIFHRLPDIKNEGPASYAQSRIWFDERIRFDRDKPQVAINNMPFLYRLHSQHTLSTTQLHHALQLTLTKHQSLRTSIIFDNETNKLIQRIIDINDHTRKLFTFIESTFETDEQLHTIMYDEKYNSQLFHLDQGLVFRCHILYYKKISSNNLLCDKDRIIFNFHHVLFDFPSMKIFLHDLNQAYITNQLPINHNTDLRYLDYALIEQQMPMTSASMFWLDTLLGCNLDRSLSLPCDRHRLSNEHRTGHTTSISFGFGQDHSYNFLNYASTNNIELQHLALAAYYMFLFKLTNGEKDICIGMNTYTRYKDELKSIIGLYENLIPLRCRLDRDGSFHELVEYVQEMATNCIKYSYFPLQHILAQHSDCSKPTYLDVSFNFVTIEKKIMIGDSELCSILLSITINEDEDVSKFDFILTIQYDLTINQLSCIINASLNLFNQETINKISQQFHSMLYDLFTSVNDIMKNKSIYEMSIMLPNERLLIQSMNNTQVFIRHYSQVRIRRVLLR